MKCEMKLQALIESWTNGGVKSASTKKNGIASDTEDIVEVGMKWFTSFGAHEVSSFPPRSPREKFVMLQVKYVPFLVVKSLSPCLNSLITDIYVL
jgi:hypothetical protein